jgi:hypothetical protein
MLIENTICGVRNKIEEALLRLKNYEPKEGYWLAFSGGGESMFKWWMQDTSKIDKHQCLLFED